MEQIDLNSGRYAFQGTLQQARPERELILIRGEKPVEHTTWITRHGPIWRNDGPRIFTMRWIAAEPGKFQFPFLELDMARNWDQFRAAMRRLPAPSSNLVYADVDGNIGYQAVGLFPIRRTYEGDVPANGASGDAEWDGFIPFDELPSAFNPPSGVIVSANQNPFPPDYKYRVGGEYGPYYRSQQIRSLLIEGSSRRRTCSRFRKTCTPRSRTSSRSKSSRHTISAARRTHLWSPVSTCCGNGMGRWRKMNPLL